MIRDSEVLLGARNVLSKCLIEMSYRNVLSKCLIEMSYRNVLSKCLQGSSTWT